MQCDCCMTRKMVQNVTLRKVNKTKIATEIPRRYQPYDYGAFLTKLRYSLSLVQAHSKVVRYLHRSLTIDYTLPSP